MMIDERVLSLKRKLEKKRGCQLNPPLSEEAVQSLESQFHFVLPEEYRRFLILAGNGGQIPPITEDCNTFLPLPTDAGQLAKLHLPFAFQDSCVWEDGSKDWIDAFRGNGTIRLAEDETDNQITWLLIVTGEHSGEIWLRGEAGIWRVEGTTRLCRFTPYMTLNIWMAYLTHSRFKVKRTGIEFLLRNIPHPSGVRFGKIGRSIFQTSKCRNR